MNGTPNVPMWVAVLVAVLISMIGISLAYTDPAVTFLTPTVKFFLVVANGGLGTFAVMLGIRTPAGSSTVSETKTTTTKTPTAP